MDVTVDADLRRAGGLLSPQGPATFRWALFEAAATRLVIAAPTSPATARSRIVTSKGTLKPRHIGELWWRYFALGGSGPEPEIEAVRFQAFVPSGSDRDVLAVALNERLVELGRDHPIPYSDDDQ